MSKRKPRKPVIKSRKNYKPFPRDEDGKLLPLAITRTALSEEELRCIRECFPGHHGDEPTLRAIEAEALSAKREFLHAREWKRQGPTLDHEKDDTAAILDLIRELETRLQPNNVPPSAHLLAMQHATDNFSHPVNFCATLDAMGSAYRHALEELNQQPSARGSNASKAERQDYINALVEIYETRAAPIRKEDDEALRAEFVDCFLRCAGAELPEDLSRLISKALNLRAQTAKS